MAFGNSLGFWTQIDGLGLKYGILGENSKTPLQEEINKEHPNILGAALI